MDGRIQEILQTLDSGEINEQEAEGLIQMVKASPQKDPEFVEQAPEELGIADRAIAESFGANPEAKLAYYQKKYPQSDVQMSNGRVTFKGEGNKRYYADPDKDGFDGFKELGRDILEGIVPVGSGVVEAAAAGVGGLAGAAGGTMAAPGAGTIAGGLAGASLAGGASGDLLERGRQGIGSMLGIPNNTDSDNISLARTFGAVSPLLLGFDKPARLLKGPLKGLAETASKEIVGKGALSGAKNVAVNKMFPATAAMMSGKSKESIKNLVKNYDRLSQSVKSTPLYQMYENLGDNINKGFSKQYNKISSKFGREADKVSSLTGGLDISKNLRPLRQVQSKYRKSFEQDAMEVMTESLGDSKKAKSLLSNYFSKNPNKKQVGVLKRLMKGRESFKDHLHVENVISSRLPINAKVAPSRVLTVKDKINDLSGVRVNKDGVGKGALDRDIINASKQTASNLDKKLSRMKGGKEFKKIKNKYAEVAKQRDTISNKFGATKTKTASESTESSIKKLFGSGNETSKEEIMKAAKSAGVDIKKRGRDIQTTKDFLDPSLSPFSDTVATGSRAIPLSAAGGLVGYQLGANTEGGYSGGLMGAAGGSLVGAMAGGPKAIRNYIRMMNAAGKGRKAVMGTLKDKTGITTPQIFNVWENMNRGE